MRKTVNIGYGEVIFITAVVMFCDMAMRQVVFYDSTIPTGRYLGIIIANVHVKERRTLVSYICAFNKLKEI